MIWIFGFSYHMQRWPTQVRFTIDTLRYKSIYIILSAARSAPRLALNVSDPANQAAGQHYVIIHLSPRIPD